MAHQPCASDTPRRSVKWYRKLSTKKGRRESGLFLLEGSRAIRHVKRHQPEAIVEVLCVGPIPPEFQGFPLSRITARELVAIANTKSPQGVLAVVSFSHDLYSNTLPSDVGDHVLILEDVQDPGNVGALIRTATAFGFSGVILSEKCADPLAPKAVQATAGTVLSVWLRRTSDYVDLVRLLNRQGYVCAATDPYGQDDLTVMACQSQLMLALGNEAAGLSSDLQRIADYHIKIPMRADVESLNVAVSGAICMYACAAHGHLT